MNPDKDGCTCYDETVRPCPVHTEKKVLTELPEEEYIMEKYGVQHTRQYKIIDTVQTKTLERTEELLNELAKEHWEVVGVTDHWIYLKRRTVNIVPINEG